MEGNSKRPLTEGIQKKGGLNKPPTKPKPNVKPIGQGKSNNNSKNITKK